MPDKASEDRHHDATPGSAADRSVRVAVPDSFPASDRAAITPAVGVRAMDVAGMMEASRQDVPHARQSAADFQDHVTAKLALEQLVREIPLDRSRAMLSGEGDRTVLEVTASKADLDRVAKILRDGGGGLRDESLLRSHAFTSQVLAFAERMIQRFGDSASTHHAPGRECWRSRRAQHPGPRPGRSRASPATGCKARMGRGREADHMAERQGQAQSRFASMRVS